MSKIKEQRHDEERRVTWKKEAENENVSKDIVEITASETLENVNK